MKQKILSALLALGILLGLAACGVKDGAAERQSHKSLTVVTTLFPAYDFARELCGDRCDSACGSRITEEKKKNGGADPAHIMIGPIKKGHREGSSLCPGMVCFWNARGHPLRITAVMTVCWPLLRVQEGRRPHRLPLSGTRPRMPLV